MTPPNSMEKTVANIDRKNLTLKIVCTHTVRQIADIFANLLNHPQDGRYYASKFEVDDKGNNVAEIIYAHRQQAIVMRDGDAVYITDAPEGVGIDDICDKYKRLCDDLEIKIED